MLEDRARLGVSEEATLHALRAITNLSSAVQQIYLHVSSTMDEAKRDEVDQLLNEVFSAMQDALGGFDRQLKSKEQR